MSEKEIQNIGQSTGKLKSLTLVEKLRLIEIVERGRSVKDVAEEFSINRNTLHYILKNKDKIREGISTNPGIAGYKRIKQTKSPELEQRILEYMLESRANEQKLSGSIIKTVALEFAAELGVENFAGSNGWLHSFFKRNRININDFNKGIDPYHEANEINNFKIIEEYQENDTVDSMEQDDSAIDSKDFGIEMIEEEFQEDLKDVQEDHLDLPWGIWCRFCGKCETRPELEPHHIEIVQKLLEVSSNYA